MKILSKNLTSSGLKVSNQTNFKGLKTTSKVNKEIARTATNVFTFTSATAISAFVGLAITKKQKEEEEKRLIQQLQNPDEFLVALGEELGKHKRVSKEDIYNLGKYFEYAPGFISDLVFLKDESGNPRSINNSEIDKIMQAYNKNPELVETLVAEKNDKGRFKYRGNDIVLLTTLKKDRPDLCEVAQKNPERVFQLSQKKDSFNRALYSAKDISIILEIEESKDEFGNLLLKMKNLDSSDIRFTPSQVKILMKKHEKFPEIIEKIIKEKSNNKSYFYSTDEIVDFVKILNEDNIEKATKLVNQQRTSITYAGKNNCKTYITPYYQLYEIINILDASSKPMQDFCSYLIKKHSFYTNELEKLLEIFDIKSIPQEVVSNIEKNLKENKNSYYTLDSLYILKKFVK